MKPNSAVKDDFYGTTEGYTEYGIEGIVLPAMSREFFYRMQGTLDDGTMRIFIQPEPLAGIKVEMGDRIKNGVTGQIYEVLQAFEYVVEDELVVIEAICK
jgi:hypothetical protein